MVKIDHKLNFNEHVLSLCKNVSQKLNIPSQIRFPQIVWTHHNRKVNERIDNIYERALRIVDKDYKLSSQELLIEDKSSIIYHRNLQKRLTEVSKVKNGFLSSELLNDFFEFIGKPYSLRTNSHFG